MSTTKEHLANFCIAGLSYYDAVDCFKKLKVGTKLRLELDEKNKYDARAVAIYYKKHKLGFIPRTENRIFFKLLRTFHEKSIVVKIQRISPNANPENQIHVMARLVGKPEIVTICD
ncbi:MAG: HIRAN domain-containing protein [Flavobacteriaceae bacterium]